MAEHHTQPGGKAAGTMAEATTKAVDVLCWLVPANDPNSGCVLLYGSRCVGEVWLCGKAGDQFGYHWKSCDGRSTFLAGEPGVSRNRARRECKRFAERLIESGAVK